MPDLLIIGGGYAGVWAAMAAARRAEDSARDLNIRLLSKEAYLTHRPRLYECNPQDMRSALEPVLAPIGVELIITEVRDIDAKQKRVLTSGADETAYAYDGLILAAGSVLRPQPWGEDQGGTWSIDTHEDAVALDDHFATLKDQQHDQTGDHTVAIIGAGFTGIELATEMRVRLAEHIGREQSERARVILLDAAGTISEELGPGPRPHVLAALEAAKVELALNATINRIDGDQIILDNGERITAATIVVTTGLQANDLAAGFGLATDATGRLPVDGNLAVKGLEDIFGAGDIAHAMTDDSHVALMSCQHAMPMGKYAGHNAASSLLGLPMLTYEQARYVTCLDLGPWGAVFTSGWEREVQAVEQEAKARKQFIMTEAIYPPTNDRAAILEAGAIG